MGILRINHDFVNQQYETIAQKYQRKWKWKLAFKKVANLLDKLTLGVLMDAHLFNSDTVFQIEDTAHRLFMLKQRLRLLIQNIHIIVGASFRNNMDKSNGQENPTAESICYS
jgi:hypothetical protein